MSATEAMSLDARPLAATTQDQEATTVTGNWTRPSLQMKEHSFPHPLSSVTPTALSHKTTSRRLRRSLLSTPILPVTMSTNAQLVSTSGNALLTPQESLPEILMPRIQLLLGRRLKALVEFSFPSSRMLLLSLDRLLAPQPELKPGEEVTHQLPLSHGPMSVVKTLVIQTISSSSEN